MPYIVTGEPSGWDRGTYDENINYEYPEGLDLHPESDFHRELRSKVFQRARASRNEISKRFSSWREIDKSLTVYMPLKDKEEALKKEDSSKPVSIVFPYSYSMLEALLTYLSMAFFQDPIFQYDGVEDDDTVGAMLMQMVIKNHCIKNKVMLNIHTVLRDCLGYGVGIAIPEWRRQYGRRPVKSSIITQSDIGENVETVSTMLDDLLYEGNALSNIDPYMWLPDPSVASSEIQRGEFIGWVERDNYMNLLSEEGQADSGKFNVKYLRKKKNKRSSLALDQSERDIRHGGPDDLLKHTGGDITSPVDVIRMYVNLIPKDWKLSSRDSPEKWYFELAGDDVIIAAERADHNHGMYPVAVASPEFDGYSITPVGRMEVLHGLQHTLDFLFNSHIANVRKAVNDMLVVDPYLVNINDLKDPQPGKLIRLRRPAWGRGVDKVVQQLEINDITRANIGDSTYITGWMDRISGADQSMQGSLRQGGPERLTGVEFQGTRSSAVSRLQRLAMIIGVQFMQDIGNMFAVHTQQYMSADTFVKIVGSQDEQIKKMFGDETRKKVTPDDVIVNYDLVVRDGSVPGGNFSNVWIELFKTIGTNEQLIKEFDISRIFMYIAQQLGAKNVEDFKRKTQQIDTQVMPDEDVQREVEAGNMVPAMGA